MDIDRSKEQCKSRFETIKRQIHRAIRACTKPRDYDFIDYILE